MAACFRQHQVPWRSRVSCARHPLHSLLRPTPRCVFGAASECRLSSPPPVTVLQRGATHLGAARKRRGLAQSRPHCMWASRAARPDLDIGIEPCLPRPRTRHYCTVARLASPCLCPWRQCGLLGHSSPPRLAASRPNSSAIDSLTSGQIEDPTRFVGKPEKARRPLVGGSGGIFGDRLLQQLRAPRQELRTHKHLQVHAVHRAHLLQAPRDQVVLVDHCTVASDSALRAHLS